MSHDHSKRFDPANLHRLEDPDRQQLFPIDRIISLAAIKPRTVIADIGAGTGYFAIPLAKLAAPSKLFAVDVSAEMLDYLRNKLAQPAMPHNVELVSGEATATNLADACCDVVFTSAVWHEIDDRPQALAEFARILKPGGRLIVVDWSPTGTRPPGPPLDHRVPLTEVQASIESAKWTVARAEALNDSIYLLVANRP